MEPTDESDGFVNITPDPNALLQGSTTEPDHEAEGAIQQSPTSPRRPTTRSQTTTTPSAAPRGNTRDAQTGSAQGEPSTSQHALDDADEGNPEDDDEEQQYEAPPPPPQYHGSAYARYTAPSQYTFLETYTSASQTERRGPRTRTAPPVPVPNLTKKSRGRRVPTTAVKETPSPVAVKAEGVQKAARVYVCKVEECGKCFSRGEHLKRHIRSIHTHEKPFQCSHPACDKYFNRHDNLLQHQKVHKGFSSPKESGDASYGPLHRMQQGSNYDNPQQSPPSENAMAPHAQPYQIFSSYHHSPPSGSAGYATNMAVSSLRTELSPSQVEPVPLPQNMDGPPSVHYPRAAYEHAPTTQGPPS
ncbi:hypothetical protein FIBSPDRAFT_852024, partial [Athelia psychrophila]